MANYVRKISFSDGGGFFRELERWWLSGGRTLSEEAAVPGFELSEDVYNRIDKEIEADLDEGTMFDDVEDFEIEQVRFDRTDATPFGLQGAVFTYWLRVYVVTEP